MDASVGSWPRVHVFHDFDASVCAAKRLGSGYRKHPFTPAIVWKPGGACATTLVRLFSRTTLIVQPAMPTLNLEQVVLYSCSTPTSTQQNKHG